APLSSPGRGSWHDLVGHRPGIRLEDAQVFDRFLVLAERTDARTQLRLCDPDTGVVEVLPMPHDASTVALGSNPIMSTSVLRFVYTSLSTPTEVIDLDTTTGERTLVKRQPVKGGYDPERYITWRTWAQAPDGERVPISLV